MEILEQENKQLKEKIEKAKEYAKVCSSTNENLDRIVEMLESDKNEME